VGGLWGGVGFLIVVDGRLCGPMWPMHWAPVQLGWETGKVGWRGRRVDWTLRNVGWCVVLDR